jgi:protein-tyrosine-phosphatase
VTLSPEAHHKVLDMTRSLAADVEYWPMPDPSVVQGSRDQKLAAYRDVRDALQKKINARLTPSSGASV